MRRGPFLPTLTTLFSVCAALAFLSACAQNSDGGGSSSSAKPMADYCPYVSSARSFSPKVTISGHAYYEYRYLGNGSVTNGTTTFRPSGSDASYSLTINGTTFTSNVMARAAAATDLATKVAADGTISAIVTATAAADAYGYQSLKLTLKDSKVWPTYTSVTNLTQDGGNPNPIRYAEIRVLGSDGSLVQCAETQSDGSFSFELPKDSQTYTVEVAARSSNTKNTAYIMNNPTDNEFYKISTTVTATADNSSVWLMAPATGSLEGGAFNILDQILNAQNFLRTETAACNSTFSDCTPFTVAPVVFVYWSPGVSPGTYFGISGGISFYLNDKRELYLLGGLNGDTTVSDMDHFDNSVIIHEYGHFIEDQYGNPNSPGGSHNGNSIIDPRLAWGEGWSDFFQAAVTGYPYYRDTKGTVDCSTSNPTSCTSVSFSEPLDSQAHDVATDSGEGNFHEFSVARLLYSVLQPSTSAPFSAIWTVFNGSTNGMKVVNDPFKSIGRFHVIQKALFNSDADAKDWSSNLTTENQEGSLRDYGRTFTLNNTCARSPILMTPSKPAGDDGSFAKSNQFSNNDFYRFDQTTSGIVTIQLTYDKPASAYADLDLYLYKSGYVFGRGSDMAAYSNSETDRVGTSTTGRESISVNLGAGTYMINVMAYTGVSAGSVSGTNYSLTINGTTLCPDP